MSELLFSDDDRWVSAKRCSDQGPLYKWFKGPCPRSFARKKHPGRQSTPPGTCLNLHLDGLCCTAGSTDAHATPLLHCLCSSKPQVPGQTFAHPATAPEAGRVASGGRGPAQHDPRGRLKAAPRGSSAAGRAGTIRSVMHCKKNACTRTTLIPRASERAHGAANRCEPHRSTPWSYGCGEGEAKCSNRCISAHLGLVYFLLKMQYLLNDLLPPRPTQYAPHHHHTRSAALFWPLQVQVDPDMSSPLRKMQTVVPWASSGVAVATDAGFLWCRTCSRGGQGLMVRGPCSR